MKKYTYTLFSFTLYIVFSFNIVLGQNVDPIIGSWVNSYNSVLTIESHSQETGIFKGIYSSSTGASGKYAVIGFSPYAGNFLETQNIPISLTIYWKKLSGGKITPDQEWTSTMSGLLLKDKSGNLRLQMLHSLNASIPLKAVEIDQIGRYTETLIFLPKTTDLIEEDEIVVIEEMKIENQIPEIDINLLTGKWTANDFESILEILNVDLQTGSVIGTYQNNLGTVPLSGYTTIFPSGENQSVSLSLMSVDGKFCYGMGGFLFKGGNLELLMYKAKAVKSTNNFSAVGVQKKIFTKESDKKNIIIPLSRNPFTNNGSTDWTGLIPVGTPKSGVTPQLKFGMDTGGNFIWVNSVQCKSNPCVNYGHTQFNQNNSSSFHFIDPKPKKINWGPWGSAMANLGTDKLYFGTQFSEKVDINMKLITDFSDTAQFQEFLWDGALAFPVDSRLTEADVSNVLLELVDNDLISVSPQGKVCVSFYYDENVGEGFVQMGSDCTSGIPNIEMSSQLIFKQKAYKEVPYLWASTLTSLEIGKMKITSSGSFSFDTGSSALKGDSKQLTKALDYAISYHKQKGVWPNIIYKMGKNTSGKMGELILTSDQYVKYIDQGEGRGTYVPQIQTLEGTPNLYLQGTTLLSSVYSVFWYSVENNIENPSSKILVGDEVWLFNYINGPKIIQNSDESRFKNESINQLKTGLIFSDLSNNNMLNVKINLHESEKDIFLQVYDFNGHLMYEKEYDYLPKGENTLSIESDRFISQKLVKSDYLIVKLFNKKQTFLSEKIKF